MKGTSGTCVRYACVCVCVIYGHYVRPKNGRTLDAMLLCVCVCAVMWTWLRIVATFSRTMRHPLCRSSLLCAGEPKEVDCIFRKGTTYRKWHFLLEIPMYAVICGNMRAALCWAVCSARPECNVCVQYDGECVAGNGQARKRRRHINVYAELNGLSSMVH